jgi:hypothetical protein
MVGLPRSAVGTTLSNPNAKTDVQPRGLTNQRSPQPAINFAFGGLASRNPQSYLAPMRNISVREDNSAYIRRWALFGVAALVMVVFGLGASILLSRPALALIALVGFALWYVVAEFSPDVDGND